MPNPTLEIIKYNNLLLLKYRPNDGTNWLDTSYFDLGYSYTIKDIFKVSENDIYSDETYHYSDINVFFKIGELQNDGYYHIYKHILSTQNNVLIFSKCNITPEYFGSKYSINVISIFEEIIQTQVIIGSSEENEDSENIIPENIYENLVKNFPTNTEKHHYVYSRISNILSEYVSTTKDYGKLFKKYLERKNSKFKHLNNTLQSFKEYEIEKYSLILEQLQTMLDNTEEYQETDWQNKILEFILLIFPRYTFYIKELNLKKEYTGALNNKRIDIALFDANGTIDVVEIKKPNAGGIITSGLYRDNYIPTRTLSGSVMQTEKYLHYLNRLGEQGENMLNNKYKNLLSKYNTKIHIINPKGIVIAGDARSFSKEQQEDFEIIRRKYSRVIDIITYDDLIRRLENTILAIKKRN